MMDDFSNGKMYKYLYILYTYMYVFQLYIDKYINLIV